MSNYIPTGAPDDNTRGIAKQVRDEFKKVETAVNSKSDRFSYTSVSTTSMAIGTGLKTFLIETGKDFVPPQTVFIADALAPTLNNMTGDLVTYDSSSGVIQVNVTSVNGSGTKSSWTIGLANDNGVTLVNNSFSGHQNFARATVASHATDADIWNAAGNQINFTGTATVTAFPNAPQGGATRELICSAGCSFTASANMLIDGYSSGQTVTCAANDVVIVRAVSATQFRLTRQRYDGKPQKEVGNHVVTVHTGNGYGSTNTVIDRFTTVLENTGSAITYADSATLGSSFTINEDGYYEVYFQKYFSSSSLSTVGVSLNSNQLTTGIASITTANRVILFSVGGSTTANNPGNGSRILRLSAGDVIRPHADSAIASSSIHTMFSIRKVANHA